MTCNQAANTHRILPAPRSQAKLLECSIIFPQRFRKAEDQRVSPPASQSPRTPRSSKADAGKSTPPWRTQASHVCSSTPGQQWPLQRWEVKPRNIGTVRTQTCSPDCTTPKGMEAVCSLLRSPVMIQPWFRDSHSLLESHWVRNFSWWLSQSWPPPPITHTHTQHHKPVTWKRPPSTVTWITNFHHTPWCC